jgi:hypothetical protein
MHATYPYDVTLGQLERATTQEDVDTLLREYTIYVRGMLEDKHPASEVTAERIVEHVGADVGWLLGEVGADVRARVMPMLPEQVQHPVVGRKFDVSIDELLLAGAAWVQGLPRGGARASG